MRDMHERILPLVTQFHSLIPRLSLLMSNNSPWVRSHTRCIGGRANVSNMLHVCVYIIYTLYMCNYAHGICIYSHNQSLW